MYRTEEDKKENSNR